MNGLSRGWRLPVALAFGLALGWVVAGRGEAERGGREPEASGKSQRRSGSGWNRDHVPPYARAMAQRVTQGRTLKDRMRAAIELANSIPVDQIETWLDEIWFDSEEGRVDMVYYDILYARLFEAYPERFLKRCLRKEIDRTGEYMAQWTENDPAAAEAFIRSLKDKNQIQSLGDDYLAVLAKTNPESTLDFMEEWARKIPETYWLSDALEPIAKTNRAELLERLDSWPHSLRNLARQHVGLSWLREDFRGGVAWIAEQPNGARLFAEAIDDDSDLAHSVQNHFRDLPAGWLDSAIRSAGYEMVRNDPLSWLAFDAETLGVSENNFRNLQSYVVSRIASGTKYRAEALALAAVGSELSESARRSLVGALAGSWDRNDLAGAEAWLAGLGEGQVAEAGRAALVARQNSTSTSSQSAMMSPANVVGQLAAEGDGRFSDFYRLRYWTAGQLAEAQEAFTELPAAERDRAAHNVVHRGSSYVAPALMADSLSHLLATEPASGENAVQERRDLMSELSRLSTRWGDANPRAATEWVETLPGAEERTLAARNVFNSWSRHEPAQAARWLEGLGITAEPEEGE